MMMERMMVALDLDDTLLDKDKHIDKETAAYLNYLQNERDVFVTFATGRPYRALEQYYQQIGLNGKIICNNGGLIIAPREHNRIYFEIHYQASCINRIIDHFGLHSFSNIMVEDGSDLYLAFNNNTMDNFCYKKGMNVIYGNHFHEIKSPSGAIFVLKDREQKNDFLAFASKCDKNTGIRFWDNSTVAELYMNNVNKASAIAELAAEEGIKQSNIIAFGDGESDLEMIYKAGIGIAMKNASFEIKKAADMISFEDNNHDGVRETLKFLLSSNHNPDFRKHEFHYKSADEYFLSLK